MSNCDAFECFYTYTHEVPRLTLTIVDIGYLLGSQWTKPCYN